VVLRKGDLSSFSHGLQQLQGHRRQPRRPRTHHMYRPRQGVSKATCTHKPSNAVPRRNTINVNIVEEIINIFELVDQDDRIRVVILTAEPTAPAFCSGVISPF
jgi:1,4-dihydroxy-2-naphthoyl-CoA synthase